MKSTGAIVLGAALLLALPGVTHAGLITFDTDADGNPLVAPATFAEAPPLLEQYASLGVHFSSPSTNSGRILAGTGWGGVPAPHSGANDVRFNELGPDSYDAPMNITFDSLMSEVSLYAGSGGHDFTLTAFDAADAQVDQFTGVLSGTEWVQLTVSSASGIKKVVFDANNSLIFYAFDDLSFTPVPEPTSLVLLSGLGVMGLAAARRRRRTA